MAVKDWSTTAASNTGILTGLTLDGSVMTPPQVDNAFREMAAQIASQLGKLGFKGADIASAATTNLATATGWYLDITGTTTITAFGTVDAGQIAMLRFTGILTLTHNASSLILPGAANITTAAGDVAFMMSLGSGNWRCLVYQQASGIAVTLTGTQTLTNKTLTSPTITTSPTAAGATWTSLGTVTTADINGGTIDGAVIGGASAAAATVTTLTGSGALTGFTTGAFSDHVRAGGASSADTAFQLGANNSGMFLNSDTGVGISLLGADNANFHATGFTVGVNLGPALVDPTGPSAGCSMSHAGQWASYVTGVGTSMQIGQDNSTFNAATFIRVSTTVGSISCSAGATAYNTSSDGRRKENKRAFDSGSIVEAIDVWEFDWIGEEGAIGYGVIAQDAMEAFPNAITLGPDGYYVADYSKYVPVLMAEIKDLRRRLAAAGL